MLHFILNYKSIHKCVDFLKDRGFHDNSFIIGPIPGMPLHLNTLNLPEHMVNGVIQELKDKLTQSPEGYLKNSYENLLKYYTTTPFKKNLKSFYYNLGKMDQRRKQNSRIVFSELFHELDAYEIN